MRKILIGLLLIVTVQGFGQVGYTKIFARYDWIAGKLDSGLHVPGYSTTPNIRAGVYTGSGNIGLDTVAHTLWYYSDGWIKLFTSGSGWSLDGNATTSGKFLGTTDGQPLAIYTNNTERMRILSTGNVGIGTTSAASVLNIKKNDIGLTSSDANGILLTNSGQASAGNSQLSPPIVWQAGGYRTSGAQTRQLRWKADLYPLQGVTQPQGVWRLGYSIDSGTVYNPVLRINGATAALTLVSDSATSQFGTFNSVLLNSFTNNLYVLASGTQPPIAATGQFNVGVGISSLTAITSADYNTGIGYGALNVLTSGGLNTAVGAQALKAQTTGISNTAVGVNALLTSTTGFQNTAIGAGAGENLTTGQENTFVGYDAGLNNTTGLRNTYVGWNAKGSAKGIHNTHLGYLSGASVLDSAANNTFIGESSGYNAAQKSDADNTIALGADTYTTKNNQAMIGNNAVTETILRGVLIDSTLGTATTANTLYYNTTDGVITYGAAPSGGSPAGNFGNIQINRNGAFATPGSDSLDFESATGFTVKGAINGSTTLQLGSPTASANNASNIQSLTNTFYEGYSVWANNNSAQFQIGYGGLKSSGVMILQPGTSAQVDGSLFVGGQTAPTTKLQVGGRFAVQQGADVASTTNLVLGSDGNTFEITGTNTIDLISKLNWVNGSEINLVFSDAAQIRSGQTTSGDNTTIILQGGAQFDASADDVLTLVLCEVGGVVAWREKCRSVN